MGSINLARRLVSHQIPAAKDSQARKVPSLFVVSKDPKELVFLYRTPYRRAPPVTHVHWFESASSNQARGGIKSVNESQWITRSPFVVAAVIIDLAMKFVGTAFGHGVHYAAGGSPILSRVVGRVDLKFLDRRGTGRV